jgi:hypothetical protein
MFDLASQVAPLLNTGAFLHLTAPSGAPLYDDEKLAVGVMLMARNSARGLEAIRANGNRRLSEARRTGGVRVTVESSESEMAELLVACTTGWSFTTLDGEDFPYSEANARKIWTDDRFKRWREAAEEFINSEANFTKA